MRAAKFTLADKEKSLLAALRSETNAAGRVALRAGIVLRSATGLTDNEVAAEFQVSVHTVVKWRRRYYDAGANGLKDGPRSGKPRTIPHDVIAAQLKEVLEARPPDGDRWSVRKIARVLGLPPATTGRIWRDFQGRQAASAFCPPLPQMISGQQRTPSRAEHFTHHT